MTAQFDYTSILIIAQLILDALLLYLLMLIYRRLRLLDRRRTDQILEALKKSQELTRQITENLSEKARLVNQLQAYLNTQNPSNPSKDQGHISSSTRDRVLSLSKKGLEIKEISRRTGLSQGEVEVIISLSNSK